MRGHPDWNVDVGRFAHYDLDTSEMAARLESIVTYNRSGRVVHIDKCTIGVRTWEVSLYGANAAVGLDDGISFRHDKSMRLTAGSDQDARTVIAKNIPIWNLSKVGMEFTFALTGDPSNVIIALFYFDGTYSYDYSVGLFFDLTNMYYEKASGGWEKLDDLIDLTEKTQYWHTLKLVVDLVNHEYVKFMFDSDEWDLLGIPGHKSESDSPPHTEPTFSVGGPGEGTNPYANVNDFIFTIDEP